MPSPIAVLPLDVTGLSLANKIEGESHSPLPGTRRLIIPRYGAFYQDNLRVFDPATDTDLVGSQYTLVDLWSDASARSGKSVFNSIIVTDPAAPAEIAITYQAYGGPHSRNAAELVSWLIARRADSTGTVDWSDITDIPKRFKPSDHRHLFAHVYGWERVVQAFGDVRDAVEVGSGAAWDEANRNINAVLESLRNNAEFLVESLVLEKFNEWKSTLSLFQFGLDLIKNYSLADEYAGQAAGAVFAPPAYEDDRYLNLRGLGYFAKSLVERVVESSTTNLGEEYGQLEDPQRGSIYVARIGTVFTLPAPNAATTIIKQTEGMYPTGYPQGDRFVITKIAADSAGTGCFLKGYNPRTAETYLGILTAARCESPLTWHRYYFQTDSLDLKQLVEDHIKTNNNPHDVTKDDVKLGKLENLPVVTVDDILSRTATRKLVTLDALLYHMRAHMEGIELVRGDDGLVDLEANPMNDAKIIFAPCKDGAGDGYGEDGTPYPPEGQFISSFCDGTDKYVRWTNGKGGHVDKLAQADSDDCRYFNVPKQGEKISEFCEGYDKKVKYADGKGGSTTETLKVDDPDCGFTGHPASGEVIATFCSGVNQMVRYADGYGGYYDMPSMINTYLCGGTIYPTPPDNTGTPDPTGTPAPGSVTMEYATSHTTISPGTVETITATLRGGQPNTTYGIEFWLESTAVNGKRSAGTSTVTTDAQGTGIRILQVTDDGVLIPRGVYTSWVECAEFEAVSNTIDRTFIGGAPGTATVVYSSTHSTITPGVVETITASLTGGAPNTTYNVEYWLTSSALPAPQTRKAGTGTITTNSQGVGSHSITNGADDGTSIPRGSYLSWAKIVELNIESVKVTRVFAPAATGNPTITYSSTRSTISPGMTETITSTLTGASPNTTYQIEYWITSSALPAPQTRQAGTGTITTNAQGTGTHTVNNPADDGTSIPRGVYQSWNEVPSLGIKSVKVNRTFVAGNTPAPTQAPTPAPNNASITYSSSHTTISPGTVETISANITNAAPNTTYQIEFWITSSALPAPQTRKAGTGNITTNALGNGSFTVTNPADDGVSIPRGQYTSWVTCPVLNKTSATVVRSFIGTPAPTPAPTQAPTPAPNNASITYSSSHTTISPGTVETIRAIISNGAPNTTYQIEFWITSSALPAPQTRKAGTGTITTSSNGFGIFSVTNPPDDGTSIPRGQYTSWVTCPALNKASATVVRTFTSTSEPTPAPTQAPTPAPTQAPTPAPKNPSLTYSTNRTNITVGQTETISVSLTNAASNTTYVVDLWIYSTALPSPQTRKAGTVNVNTNASGSGSYSWNAYDDGTIPRGSYTSWAVCPSLNNLTSPQVVRTFTGTPAPTPAPYNPVVQYYSSHSTITVGVTETQYVRLTGMYPDSIYTVELRWETTADLSAAGIYPDAYGVSRGVGSTVNLTTDASGAASTQFTVYDNGGVPRGTWTCYAYIVGLGVTSTRFNRYLA